MTVKACAVRFMTIAGVVGSTGCYSYLPANLETVPVGQDVRVMLSRQGRIELPEQLDVEGSYIAGKVARRDAERFYINMAIGRRQQGFYVADISQEVGVRTGEIVEVEIRKLNAAKTGLFVAGTAAAAALVVYGIIEASHRGEPGTPPGPEEFRIPIFSIPVGR